MQYLRVLKVYKLPTTQSVSGLLLGILISGVYQGLNKLLKQGHGGDLVVVSTPGSLKWMGNFHLLSKPHNPNQHRT